jgi:uroporphyrin-III C-methyltransferase / precorrin-2 dehydrogenase / sirohydrochlorin ferrochelatase
VIPRGEFFFMRFLPVFLDVTQGTVALVGTGPEALSKLRLLQSAGARVRWHIEEFELGEFAAGVQAGRLEISAADVEAGRLEICTADPCQADYSDLIAIVAAAGEPRDAGIAARARECRVPVNVVDRPELSTFIFPAIVDRGDVVVAIGTGGTSPVLARRLRERIEALLPGRIGDFAALMGRFRTRVAQRQSGKLSLRRFWESVIDGPIGVAALAGRWHWAEAALSRLSDHPGRESRSGLVVLAGAGPGDADLLTLRALQALQSADVVFYDELIGAEILDRARRDAKRIFVGKRSGQPGIAQDVINQRLAEAARQGLNVVRLKGGDPFIFGRGGEELEYLRQAGIAVVVVPGITAALGCAAEAGLPLSFRDEASAIAFVTAHHAGKQIRTDWVKFADPATTVVIYMGLGSAGEIGTALIAAGRDAGTPAAVLVRGTRPDAVCRVGRLDGLAQLATEAGEGPGLLVVGSTVARSDAWRALIDSGVVRTEAAA